MRKKRNICFLYTVLLIMLILLVFAIYMSYKTQTEYEAELSAAVEEYDYEEIQELVQYNIPTTVIYEDKTVCAPYDIQEMLQINEDFKGWLWIPDTDINYPVVQTDNNDLYLKQSFSGEYSSYGTLFLDTGSISGSKNRVIHGHNMGSNRTEMFSGLVQYQDPVWAAERKIAYFTEPDSMEDSTYELFAVLNFDVNHLDNFNYLQADFDTEDDLADFIDYLKSNSLYESSFQPERDILILSTCNRYYGYDNRLLVCFGRK